MTRQDTPLKPSEFSPQTTTAHIEDPASQRPHWLIPATVGLLLVGVIVFFVLPAWVSNRDLPPPLTAPPAEVSTAAVSTDPADAAQAEASPTPSNERSPFAEAQLQKQRRAAQEALQAVLTVQESLLERAVEQWALEPYQAAISQAAIGDAAYREQRFDDATRAYGTANQALIDLEASIPSRVAGAQARLLDSVETGDEPAAQQALELLERLTDNDQRLAGWRARVAAIATVTAALNGAEKAAINNDFQRAIDEVTEALSADSLHRRAAERLVAYQQSLVDNQFRQAMSRGYLALENNRFEEAAQLFRRATTLKPTSSEPEAALVELRSARTDATLRTLRAEGIALEAQEQWQQAVERYQAALAIDKSLVFAQQGVTRAQPRAVLHQAVEAILADTSRWVDKRALQSAQALFAEAQAISSPGPVLAGQTRALADALSYALTEVDITVTSDGLTDVTLLRVKRLGALTATTATVRPGKYTALGIRSGYRDVRIDIEVTPGGPNVVDVRCTDTIEEAL